MPTYVADRKSSLKSEVDVYMHFDTTEPRGLCEDRKYMYTLHVSRTSTTTANL